MTTATTRTPRTPPAGPDAATARSSPPGGVRPSLPSLTGLRWVAALLVFGLHINNFGYLGGQAGRLVSWAFTPGGTGVSFFFILSGFVLTWSARPGDRAPGFWRRRIARVYPVHLATALIAVTVAFAMGKPALPTWKQTLANLSLVHSWWQPWWQTLNPVSWSLACEAFFYALFPALFWLLRRLDARGTLVLGGVAVTVALCLAWADAHHWLDQPLYSLPAARLPEFVLGTVTARLVLLDRWRGPGLEGSLALAILGYFLVPQVAPGYAATSCTLAGFTLLIPAAAVADLRGLPTLWRGRRLVRLGELSFAFYMVHLLVLRAGIAVLGDKPRFGAAAGIGVTVAAFMVSLGLSWALFEGVERPVRRLLLRGRRPADRPVAPSPKESVAAARD
ncbi:acyltransferase family protein [Streptomyces sp. NBC_00566]|uniref:acyltransferase family protein n=1 Tax=Streptomyces sp. NBC_00566 TaxID=2975778 RepID=UPI002E8230F3|nr:acyltransferase [Streptomyces sp. NBC_00566]WUB85350.1 acyltransferase [Streptomyces sp. NBC_00566]